MMNEVDLWGKTLQPFVIAAGFGGMTFGLLFGGGPAWFFRSLPKSRYSSCSSWSIFRCRSPRRCYCTTSSKSRSC
jgi:hypothetical protein